jgi:hypothetical protein
MRNRKATPILSFAALAAALALLWASPAAADSSFGGREGAGAGQMSLPAGLAVSQREGGDLYVADLLNQRIDEFEPSGTFVRAFGWGVRNGAAELQECTTASGCRAGLEGSHPGQFNFADEIAVDNDPASPSYGDLYVVDQRNFRVEKFDREGHFLLMFGGGVDKGPHHSGDLCTAAYIAEGDSCGAGSPGTGPSHFYESPVHVPFGSGTEQSWSEELNNSIAVAPDGSVYVGDFRRVQHFSAAGSYEGELKLPEAAFVGSLAVDSSGNVFANALPVDERQKVNLPASGTYTLTFEGQTTEPIPYNASDGLGQFPVTEALEKLSTIGAGNVLRTETSQGVLQVSFQGALGHQNLPQMTASGATVETLVEGAQGELVELAGFAAAEPSEILRTLDAAGEPTHIALDAAGDLFVADLNGAASQPPTGEFRFRAFRPDGALYAEFGSEEIQGNTTDGVHFTAETVPGLAVDPDSGELYAANRYRINHFPLFESFAFVVEVSPPAEGPPTIEAEQAPPEEIRPTSATLHATVNPRGFETSYRFEYIAAKRCEENEEAGHECFQGAEPPTPSHNLGIVIRDDPVQAKIESLTPETRYRYRVVAENEKGTTEGERNEANQEIPRSFETLPAVQIRGPFTQIVGPELLNFTLQLNSNDSLLAGHYRLRLGTDTSYAIGAREGTLHAGSGTFESFEGTFAGLEPNTTYHYQLIAENEFGKIETDDATVTTEPSAAEERQAEECPENGTLHGEVRSTLREENDSLALPDCRAYEQVSERNKEGGQAFATSSLAPSGERVLYGSQGVFAGAQVNETTVFYLAHRTPSGWVTRPVLDRPAAEPRVQPTMTANEMAFSPELNRWLYYQVPAIDQNEAFHATKSFHLSLGIAESPSVFSASPQFNVIEGPSRSIFEVVPLRTVVAGTYFSDDLSRLFFQTNTRLLPESEDPRPDGSHTLFGSSLPVAEHSDRIYELAGVGSPNPSLSLVAELSPALQTAREETGDATGCAISPRQGHIGIFKNETARLASSDASEIVYSMPVEKEAGKDCGEGKPNPIDLFSHQVGQAGSAQLNAPPASQCHSPAPCATAAPVEPKFAGLSPDGSRAWFTTAQPLIDADSDETGDLYLAKLGPSGELSELVETSAGEATPSHPTPGVGAGVIEAVRVSLDGSWVAFLATGVLTTDENALHQSALPGADNLYLYDAASGQTSFVTDLCSDAGKSGSQPNSGCVRGEAVGNLPPFKFTATGRYLVFETWARLTADDTDSRADIYRYDTQTGELVRLSFGRDGNDANGNDSSSDTSFPVHGDIDEPNPLAEDGTRAVSADGSVVIFETASPLVSKDTNEANDVYEWEEQGRGSCRQNEDGSGGCVRLVSDGLDPHGAANAVISASGRDITFHTQRGDVPADTDGVGDIYDARENGGFHYTPPPTPCGSNEICHESAPPLPAPPKITTEGETGGNGLAELKCAKGKVRVTKHGQVRCVAKKFHKAKHHKKHKRANTNRRAGK